MEIQKFFAALAMLCTEGGCEKCGAREFCYTAPHSMTKEIVESTIQWINDLNSDKPEGMDYPIH